MGYKVISVGNIRICVKTMLWDERTIIHNLVVPSNDCMLQHIP